MVKTVELRVENIFQSQYKLFLLWRLPFLSTYCVMTLKYFLNNYRELARELKSRPKKLKSRSNSNAGTLKKQKLLKVYSNTAYTICSGDWTWGSIQKSSHGVQINWLIISENKLLIFQTFAGIRKSDYQWRWFGVALNILVLIRIIKYRHLNISKINQFTSEELIFILRLLK